MMTSATTTSRPPLGTRRASYNDRSVTSALFHGDGDNYNDEASFYDATLYDYSVAPGRVPAVEDDVPDENMAGQDYWDGDTFCESLYTVDDESLYTTVTHRPFILEGIPKQFGGPGRAPIQPFAGPGQLQSKAEKLLQFRSQMQHNQASEVEPEKEVLGTMSKAQLVNMVSALMASNSSLQESHERSSVMSKPKSTESGRPAQVEPGEIQIDLSASYLPVRDVSEQNPNDVFLPPWLKTSRSPSSNDNGTAVTPIAMRNTADLVQEVLGQQQSNKALGSPSKTVATAKTTPPSPSPSTTTTATNSTSAGSRAPKYPSLPINLEDKTEIAPKTTYTSKTTSAHHSPKKEKSSSRPTSGGGFLKKHHLLNPIQEDNNTSHTQVSLFSSSNFDDSLSSSFWGADDLDRSESNHSSRSLRSWFWKPKKSSTNSRLSRSHHSASSSSRSFMAKDNVQSLLKSSSAHPGAFLSKGTPPPPQDRSFSKIPRPEELSSSLSDLDYLHAPAKKGMSASCSALDYYHHAPAAKRQSVEEDVFESNSDSTESLDSSTLAPTYVPAASMPLPPLAPKHTKKSKPKPKGISVEC